jgi:hypothetical protein
MLNQEVKETEKRNIEYKEIKGSSPINAIIDVAEIYINAFLNSRVVGIGTIKWGISDKRIVKGVKLSKDDQNIQIVLFYIPFLKLIFLWNHANSYIYMLLDFYS